MTAADHIQSAIRHCVSAKTYATSPRHVTKTVASLLNALHALDLALQRAEADARQLAELRPYLEVNRIGGGL